MVRVTASGGRWRGSVPQLAQLLLGLLMATGASGLRPRKAQALPGASNGAGGSNYTVTAPDGYSALCVVAKNENRFVREWVEYHKCLGFSRIYLYDNNSPVPLSRELRNHINSGFVSYTRFAMSDPGALQLNTTSYELRKFLRTVQGQAYKDCLDRFGSRHAWLGFIDVDEFLVVYDKSVQSVNELLQQYEAYPGLSVYWVVLGSSGHRSRPPGGVVDSYTRCTSHSHDLNTLFKTFVNTRFKPTMYSPHRAFFDAPPDPATGEEPYMVNENFRPIPRGRNRNNTNQRLAVYHYVTKSLEDFQMKMKRGGGAGIKRGVKYFVRIERHSQRICYGAQMTRSHFCAAQGMAVSYQGGPSKGSGGSSRSSAKRRSGGGRTRKRHKRARKGGRKRKGGRGV